MPKVSIIVPFYNCPYINQALDSLVNQTYEDMEIIVVNDGSTQYTELIEPYLSRIRYIEKENGGTASALNMGIAKAKGEYFAWLSSDDLFVSSKVEKQMQFMKSRKAFISYTPAININSSSHPISQPIGVEYPNRLHILKDLRKTCTINGCTVMMKMEVFSDTGMFDESLLFTHDYDFWLRAIQKYDFHYLNEPLVLHRIHDGMGTKKFKTKIYNEFRKVGKKYKNMINELISKEENK